MVDAGEMIKVTLYVINQTLGTDVTGEDKDSRYQVLNR